jgi:hypothetical protein
LSSNERAAAATGAEVTAASSRDITGDARIATDLA